MRLLSSLLIISLLFFFACSTTQQREITSIKIAFGSCANQDKPQPMLDIAASQGLDAFVFLGDNIYGDSRVMDTLKAKYRRLASKSSFQNLKAKADIYAVWDDHDYGENDSGRHYPYKKESKEIFMEFWEVPENSDRRTHDGIYGVEYLKKGDLIVQLILLDTRTFRDDLIFRRKEDTLNGHKNDYIPNQNPDSTFLGEAQWAWLETIFKAPADVRIIASSNQFSHEYNGWESWTNVPHQQKRMLELIKSTQANGVIFISGDVHWGEISKMKNEGAYPVYDVTSSGITQTWDIIEPNNNRIGNPVAQNNIGTIEILKSENAVKIEFALIDSSAQKIELHKLELSEISFDK
ncbi:MAG: alkaline phosphatase family protein [Bacteroidia bacterium]|nr:alkaline phosphatase family protein [Bacteroidia bacterium]